MDNRDRFSEVLDFFRRKQAGVPGDPDYDEAFCRMLTDAVPAEEASIWKQDSKGRLRLVYGTNVNPEAVKGIFLEAGEGISGAAALSRRTITVPDVCLHAHHSRQVDKIIGFHTKSMVSTPILYNGSLYGVLNILNYKPGGGFPPEWEERIDVLGILYGSTLAAAGRLEARPFSQTNGLPKNRDRAGEKERTVIVGISRGIQEVLHLCLKAGRTDVPVLIYGDTGTGKELTARRIHGAMIPKKRAFLGVNCAALTETILESELFGHVKGAFSGATRNRQGKFAAAAGGTLFLDEIGDMSLACQSKILRALQEKRVTPVGSDKEIDADVRIIAATNQELPKKVEAGSFREDLFYRLCGLEIRIPPLCERKEDVPLLARHFLTRIGIKKETGYVNPRPESISDEALDMLEKFSWPGNVRQLEQAVLAAATICEGSVLMPEDFPAWIHKTDKKGYYQPEIEPGTPASAPELMDNGNDNGQDREKRNHYIKALNETRYNGSGRWNITAAARHLGLARKTLAYRLKKLQIT